MSIEDFIINVFCIVDEGYQKIVKDHRLRKRGYAPKLTDEEVLTMEIVGEFLGFDADRQIWSYFKQHWITWFPQLGALSNFARQSANLWFVKQQLQEILLEKMDAKKDSHYFIDGFPLPVCHFRRAPICEVFKGSANYGYCASKAMNYYGFRGNILVNWQGVVTGLTVTQAHVGERESMWDIVNGIQGILIGDKGYAGQFLHDTLKETEIELLTPSHKRKKEKIPLSLEKLLLSLRRRVETVIGQLTERFHIQKIRTKDLWHLTSRMARKVVAHTIGIFLNKKYGNPPLQFHVLLNI